VVSPYPSFLDSAKQMPFLSFENFTIANAIKTIARSINAIPKVFGTLVTAEVPYIQNFKLTFINRNGNETAIDSEDLNTKFPIAYEHNSNSSDQFLTRSVSNISNAKSSNLVIAPEQGGFKNFVPNELVYDDDTSLNSKVFLPSRIDKIEFMNVLIPMALMYENEFNPNPVRLIIYRSYYTNRQDFVEAILNSDLFGASKPFTLTDRDNALARLPDPSTFYRVNYGDVVDKTFEPDLLAERSPVFFKKMSLRSKFEFDTSSKLVGGVTTPDADTKARTAHWTPNTNELIMPLSFRNSLNGNDDHNVTYLLVGAGTDDGQKRLSLTTRNIESGLLRTTVKNEDILVQVGYYPVADIKVSIDNDNDAQDEKFFNQSGKVIDALSVSKLITSHTNDSVEGTKIRNARYDDYANIVPLGQIVRDNNELYIVSQRSIDMMFRDNGNNYFNVIYTLSRNRIARSENIQADNSVINYKTPDENLVFRSQLYKDYIELSLNNVNQEEPYLPISKVLVLNSEFAGTTFDYTVLAKNQYGSTPSVVRYVKSPTIFDLHKAKLMNVNWQDNNVIGFRFDRVGGVFINDLVQTPIVYTDELGKATNFELLFSNKQEIKLASDAFNNPTVINRLVPFTDLTQVPTSFYDDDIVADERFSIRIQEPNYDKDPFEIPVFEYMIQGNDDYTALGNIAISNELFKTFSGTLIYHYVINNSTRFTSENAIRLFGTAPASTTRRVTLTRDNETPHILDLDLFSTFSETRNTSLIKNIGIYVTDGTNVKFLFAINDYNPVVGGINDNSNIRLYINNWKI